MKRREFLVLSSAAAAAILLGGCDTSLSQTGESGLQKALHIPPMLEGIDIDGVLHYNLSIEENLHVFFEGTQSRTFGVNGSYLGPTLRMTNGSEVSVNYTNKLKEATTMHGHGMHLPASMDGGVHQIIEPNSSWSARYRVKQKACTNWYHPHIMGKTAEHVYKGIAGMIIIDDEQSRALDLPNTYGVDDIPLILQDRFFDANGELDYSPNRMQIMHGYHGDIFVVNGVVNPYVEVEAKEIRFRLLNGSNSTVYEIGFNDGRRFKQIATDNAFLESPVTLQRVRLSPGERAEIVVDFSNDSSNELLLQEFRQNKTFVSVHVVKAHSTRTYVPDVLTELEKYRLDDALVTRHFKLSGQMGRFFINGVSMDKNIINEEVPLNQIERWNVTNAMNVEHNFHLHATHFLILERDGSSANVPENEKGYKDTVFLAPNESVTFIVKMTDYTDASNPYMYHCHFLEHEDAGMMGQFIVI